MLIILIIIKCIIIELFVFIKKCWNLINPIRAVFTRTPLRKIEKLVFASTCVFINQKLNGQSGSFILKPKNNMTFMSINTSVGIKCKPIPIILDFV